MGCIDLQIVPKMTHIWSSLSFTVWGLLVGLFSDLVGLLVAYVEGGKFEWLRENGGELVE